MNNFLLNLTGSTLKNNKHFSNNKHKHFWNYIMFYWNLTIKINLKLSSLVIFYAQSRVNIVLR